MVPLKKWYKKIKSNPLFKRVYECFVRKRLYPHASILKPVNQSCCWGTAGGPVSAMGPLHKIWVIVRLSKLLSCLRAIEPILHLISIKFRNAFSSQLVRG